VHIATTGYNDTTFIDRNAEPGETNYYQVQYNVIDGLGHPDPWTWEDNNDIMDDEGSGEPWDDAIGEKTHPVIGSAKRRLRAPVYVADPENMCGDSITLEWEAYEDTANDNLINRYLVQRAEDEDFSENREEYYVDIDTNSVEYTEKLPEQNKTYYYRIKTENSCGNLSEKWSEVVSGKALSVPGRPADLSASFKEGGVELSWTDNAETEKYFTIKRTPDDILREAPADSTSFVDDNFSVCTRYTYTVQATNSCGLSKADSVSINVNPKPADLFDTSTFRVSKGYYPDKITLNWDNSNRSLVDYYEIIRHPDSAVFEAGNNQNTFVDNSALSGKLYTYTIQAKVNCEGNIIASSKAQDVGFRLKAGSITGSVEYEENIAVENTQILIQAANDSVQSVLDTINSGVALDGDDHLVVPHAADFNFQHGFTFQAWIKPASLSGEQPIFSKTVKGNGYGISLEDSNLTVWVSADDTTYRATGREAINGEEFVHIACAFDGSWLRIMKNGETLDSIRASIPFLSRGDLFIGTDSSQTHHYSGIIDEVLLWNKGRSVREMKMDYSRVLSGREDGLVAYWRMDINEGRHVFDYSKDGDEFNKNHGKLMGARWSHEAPASEQLAIKGRTDAEGKYNITYLRYLGTGNIYEFTPFRGQDSFETLNDRTNAVYFGEDAFYNTLSYRNKSSVKVTGTVQYKDSRCMARGIGVYVDGEPVMKDGSIVKTNSEGFFEIRVPSTGQHYVSVYKKGHDFETGIWPTDSSLYSFNEPVSGIEFVDSTKIKVVGRVVGGKREKEKKPALGLSNNNIGQARIIFKSQLGFGCSTDTVYTDIETGEYEIDLLPLNYVIEDVTILNNPAIDFGTQEVLFMDSYQPEKTVYDNIYNENGGMAGIDSATFQVRRDFIYRTSPRIQVTDANNDPFIGEESLTVQDDAGNEFELDITPSQTGFPVFFAGEEYTARIFVHEKYVNADNDEVDLVPLENATIRINNNIELIEGQTESTQTVILNNEKDGDTLYTFMAGEPNFLTNSTYNSYNFTKTFKIEAEVDQVSADWKPGNSGKGDHYYRGYVMGRKALVNSDFVSGGSSGNIPVITTILRDPPGSGSSSFIEKGSSFTSAQTLSHTGKAGFELKITTDITPDTETDLPFGGPDITTSGESGPSFGLDLGVNVNDETTDATTYVMSEKISTSGAPELVGANEDVFIGSTHNYNFGTVNNITLMADSLCQQSGGPNICSDSTIEFNHSIYRVGMKKKYMLIDSIKSTFIYSQDHIKNYLMPNLIKLRNNIFVQSEAYSSNISADHPNYGNNNDDPVWGSLASSANSSNSGPSYHFHGGGTDSIRWYNQKIGMWENILRRNEEEKKLASFEKNISFEGGGNSYESQYAIEKNHSNSTTLGISLDLSVGTDVGFKVLGIGFNLDFTLKGGYAFNITFQESSASSVNYGYTLSDGDQGDYFSVDIMKPVDMDELKEIRQDALTGPIFKTVGGRSMCPWEGPVTTDYYEPIGTIISQGTLKREKPALSVTPNVQNNIPPDEAAVYKLSIGNASETNETMWYKLKVLESSNPHGAQLSLDGKSIGRVFEIPGGDSYEKTLTLKRTPGIDNYEDVQIILYSPCEWAFHTNGGVLQAVDTVSISAYFIPSCTEINLFEPEDQWVMNTTRNDTLPAIIGKYDKNYEGFKKFQVQYKEASSPKWIGLKSYWNDTTDLNTEEITPIPEDEPYTLHPWDISQIPDGVYDIRAVSFCPLSNNNSQVLRGVIDRIPPHAFGSPQPADGILSPNDEMLIVFNEEIHTGMLNLLNFDIRGILNGSELTHSVSVGFDSINDYVKIPKGILLGGKSFTCETWVKRKGAGHEVIFSQGVSPEENISLGFNEDDEFFIHLNGHEISSGTAETSDLWQHYAVTYSHEKQKVVIYRNGSVMSSEDVTGAFQSSGQIILGKSWLSDNAYFKGNLHGLRLWSTVRSQSDIVSKMNENLVGKEYGLTGSWPMNEAYGSLAKDIVHHRNATVYATWDVYPSGYAYQFPGDEGYLEAETKNLALNNATDITIEFWFNSTQGENVTFLSNGKGDGTDENVNGWCIHTDESGDIHVWNNGEDYEAVTRDYFDGTWHHFALVVDRMGNTHAYIDGELQSIHNHAWEGFGGPYLWIGSRGWFEGPKQHNDLYFEGHMDEVRIWKLARKQDQIKRYMNTKLQGDEPGLAFFLPFETYEEDAGVMVLEHSLMEQYRQEKEVQPAGNTRYAENTPNIVLNRPIEKVNFSYSHKEDRIVFKSTDPLKRIENRVLDITVSGVQDLNGNPMQSPETWSAYVDKGQIRWKEQEMIEEKQLYKPHSFTTEIENLAGREQSFSIENLPVWLSVHPQSGTMTPRSSKTLTFTISEGLNVGNYARDIYLRTDFEFDEKIALNLRVLRESPDWDVEESDYVYTMNVVGQLYINEIISDDIHDKVAAFVDGECRGVANVEYEEDYGLYQVYLDIYSNTKEEENVVLRVWDASKGRTHLQVNPQFNFQANQMEGTPSQPIVVSATDTVYERIVFEKGWNWVSFNLKSPVLRSVDSLLSHLDVLDGTEIKGIAGYDQFGDNTGWVGSLTEAGGISNKAMYMIKMRQTDTVNYSGVPVVPEKTPVPLVNGWNWIGFTPNMNMEVNDAMASLNPAANDIVKGQSEFAVYDDKQGWLGSLEYLRPHQGYMLYTQNPDTLIYPNRGIYSEPLPVNKLKKGSRLLFSGSMNETVESKFKLGSDVVYETEMNEKSIQQYARKYPYNMTMVARIEHHSVIMPTEQDQLTALYEDEIRGEAIPTQAGQKGDLYFITVNNGSGTIPIEFTYHTADAGMQYKVKESFAFQPDAMLGTPDNPVILSLGEVVKGSIEGHESRIYPNPFKGRLNIMAYNKEQSDITIKVYDVLSSPVYEANYEGMPQGWHELNWKAVNYRNEQVDPGVYFIAIQTASGNSTFKVVYEE